MVLELTDVSKHFPGVQALDRVSFSLVSGEVHGLVGENGAGKSTLMNVIGGVVLPDEGAIMVLGESISVSTPREAQELGIAFIHQELSLFPNLDVASNIFIANLPRKAGLVAGRQLREEAKTVLARVGLAHIDPTQGLGTLSPGEKQLVEIGRCLAQRTSILVLDEPTSSLTGQETDTLFAIIRELKSQGVSVIYVSHRLDEVFAICDRVTVLRDGKRIGTVAVRDVDRTDLVKMILGHEVAEGGRRTRRAVGPVALSVKGLTRRTAPRDVSFELRRGEILGITGLLGSGRTETARAIFGLDRPDSGEIWIDEHKVRIRNSRDAIQHGIGFVTENRREEGVLAEKPVLDNVVLANLQAFATRLGWMLPSRERSAAETQRSNLRIATPSVKRLVKYLSGGNQQKVVLGKWMETASHVWILDEPTRGIDIGAKEEVYRLIRDIADHDAGVIFISSEIPEIVRLCDRVLVMREGRVAAEFGSGEFTAEGILLSALGGA